MIESSIQLSVTCAVGSAVGGICDIKRSYEEAQKALSCKLYLGKNMLIPFDSVVNDQNYNSMAYEGMEGQLQKIEKCCNESNWNELYYILDHIKTDWIHQKVNDRNIVDIFCMKLILLLMQTTNRYGEYNSLIMTKGNEWLQSISGYDTIEFIFERARLACSEMISSYVNGSKNEHPKKIVEKALEYMKENFTQDISLEKTAEYVNVHPVHLSRLFRQAKLQTFKSILTQIRINEAKELLRNLDLRVYEISEKVGYKKPRYFSELFKEITGMTPLEYREKC